MQMVREQFHSKDLKAMLIAPFQAKQPSLRGPERSSDIRSSDMFCDRFRSMPGLAFGIHTVASRKQQYSQKKCRACLGAERVSACEQSLTWKERERSTAWVTVSLIWDGWAKECTTFSMVAKLA